MKKRITIDVDCINCTIQKDEELFLYQEIKKLFKGMGIKLKQIYFDM